MKPRPCSMKKGVLAGLILLMGMPLAACSPSPQKVCNKLGALASGTAFKSSGCVSRERSLRRRRGSTWYGERARCVMRTSNYTSAMLCRGKRRKGKKYRTTIRIGGKKKKKKKKRR